MDGELAGVIDVRLALSDLQGVVISIFQSCWDAPDIVITRDAVRDGRDGLQVLGVAPSQGERDGGAITTTPCNVEGRASLNDGWGRAEGNVLGSGEHQQRCGDQERSEGQHLVRRWIGDVKKISKGLSRVYVKQQNKCIPTTVDTTG